MVPRLGAAAGAETARTPLIAMNIPVPTPGRPLPRHRRRRRSDLGSGPRGRTPALHTLLASNTITTMTAAGVRRFVGISVGGLDRLIGALARTIAGGSVG